RPPSALLPESPAAPQRITEPASPDPPAPRPESRVADRHVPAMRKAMPAAGRPPRSEAIPDAPGSEITNFSALMVNGDLAFQNDRYDEALRFYRRALLLNPSD